MGARSLLLFTHALLSYGLTVNKPTHNRDIISTSKTELTTLSISCKHNDIIIISAPIIHSANTQYHLYKSTGDIVILNISEQGPQENKIIEDVKMKPTKDDKTVITKGYKVYNLIRSKSNFSEIEKHMEPGEFAIGPITDSDHGNWVLSVYYQDLNGDWMELFQVITIEILENVPPRSIVTRLIPGEAFMPSFAYPIKGLQSCEIIAPKSTFDRFYDRDRMENYMCGYVVQNVTTADQGIWIIIGVGDIVYTTKMYLYILN